MVSRKAEVHAYSNLEYWFLETTNPWIFKFLLTYDWVLLYFGAVQLKKKVKFSVLFPQSFLQTEQMLYPNSNDVMWNINCCQTNWHINWQETNQNMDQSSKQLHVVLYATRQCLCNFKIVFYEDSPARNP